VKESELKAILGLSVEVRVLLEPLEHKNATWYKLIINPDGNAEGTLLTKLNDIKTWKNLNTAIQYIEKHFPEIESVTVLTQTGVRRGSSKKK